ncbi:MAG: Peptidase protein [Ignavibacteria bacterium]|nr:Peptidase protein [Ignavibacteria bacterium]
MIKRFISFLTVALLLSISTFNASGFPTYDSYDKLLKGLLDINITSGESYNAEGYMLDMDYGGISLESGAIYPFQPLNGRTFGFFFKGSGRFTIDIPCKPEKIQMRRFFKEESIDDEIEWAMFFFGDSSVYQMAISTPKSIAGEVDFEKCKKDYINYGFGKEQVILTIPIFESYLNGRCENTLYIMMKTKNHDILVYEYNPYDEEEVSVSRGDFFMGYGYISETICQYYSKNYNPDSDTILRLKDDITIDDYTIDVVFNEDLDMQSSTKVKAKVLRDSCLWIPLYFGDYSPFKNFLKVDSILLPDGNDLEFYQPSLGSWIWVKLPKISKKDDFFQMTFYYHGNIFLYREGYQIMRTSTGWYPKANYKNKANFHLTFTYPYRYKLASVGEMLNKSEKEKMITAVWEPKSKIRNCSFNIDKYDIKNGSGSEGETFDLLYKNIEFAADVIDDVKNSWAFFSKLYGKLPYNKLNITELLAGHGEAFPGLLHLSSITFVQGGSYGYQELFRSHEVSHQWWGIGCDFLSYRDQWLSEGFADYSALIYLQLIMKDKDKFFKALVRYKEHLLELRKSFFGNGIEQGVISLGYRNSTIKSPEDYSLVVYEKGAWVLHMIRNMLLDLTTMKEDLFMSLMSDFYKKYQGKNARTIDFIRMLEDKTKIEFGWFFDQWVDDNKIPKYTFSYKVDPTSNKYKVRCRVRQENVSLDFKMFIPIKVVFADKKVHRIRAFITGANAEFDLAVFDREPEEVIFNDLESVLCEVENEKWKD